MASGAVRLGPPFGGDTGLAEPPFIRTWGSTGGDDLVDYLVGVVFLAFVLIVSLAVFGEQVASALHHA